MKKSVFRFLAAAVVLLSSQVQASPISVFSLWYDNSTRVAHEFWFYDADLTLSVTAWTSSYDSDDNQLQSWEQVRDIDTGVYRSTDGLGVVSSADDGNDLDGGSSSDFSIDPDEGLLFVFSQRVGLVDIFVGDLSSNDDINFSLVDLTDPRSPVLTQTVLDQSAPNDESEDVYEFTEDFTGSAFMLWVDGSTDDVEVLGIAVAKVPNPGTPLLLSLGLIGLRAFRRK